MSTVASSKKPFSGLLLVASLLSSLFISSLALAQHDMHGSMEDAGLFSASMPEDDEVLAEAPQSVMLHFHANVRLVKLALKETVQGQILTDFRYRPKPAMHYVQELPKLAPANFYKVEWAALDKDGKLFKGSFRFSFGEDAKPPSEYMEGMDHDMQIMSPDFRLL